MDCAYPFKLGYRRGEHDPLKWSIRALYQHYPIDRLWLYGDSLPEWVEPEAVEFTSTSQADSKFTNIGRNIWAAARDRYIGEQFLWLNDDVFLLADVGPDYPLYCHVKTLEVQVEALNNGQAPPNPTIDHRQYVIGMTRQLELLQAWGLEAPIQNCELHTPIPLIKARLGAVLDRARRDMPELEGGHFRALYGVGLPAIPIADIKIRAHTELPAPGQTMVSTTPESWTMGAIGQYLRARYWRKSPFERGG